jgi:polar amino acid transport system substrate-binding protein
MRDRFRINVTFPMLKGRQALALFEQGIINTLILVGGAICATLLFARVFLIGLRDRRWWISVPALWSTRLLQSSPIVLLLILGYFVTTAVLTYSPSVALWTSIIVIGLPNGAFAGSAMSDAARTLITETGEAAPPLAAIIRRSATQITGFAVNAARASAGASFIGTPELLNVLTDISSVTTERRTTFAILLVFYVAIVMIVVFFSGILARRFGARAATA